MGAPPYEYFSGCPYCKGIYTEAIVCNECGKYIDEYQSNIYKGKKYCDECYNNLGG